MMLEKGFELGNLKKAGDFVKKGNLGVRPAREIDFV
jgi:hypothetical protein